MAAGVLSAVSPAFARGCIPDAGVGERSRRRPPGDVASAPRSRSAERQEHAGLADNHCRACVPEHAAYPPGTARGTPGLPCARPVVSLNDHVDPEQEALVAESVGLALLVVLDMLSPSERLAFVLHDVFGVPFTDIAAVLNRSEAAAQQLASRARRRVHGSPKPDHDLARQRAVVDAFFAASRDGDFGALVAVLDPGVELRIDGGALREEASLRLRGAEAVAARSATYSRLYPVVRPALVNGAAGGRGSTCRASVLRDGIYRH